MKLDSKKTEALLAVIDSGSFDLAAQQLGLTPSAISQRIKALESQLGVPLVIRTRPCCVTREGLALIQHLSRARAMEEEFLADYQDTQWVRLPIAVNNDSLGTWLMKALADFLTREKVMIDIHVDDHECTHKTMETGMVLGAISSKSQPMRGCSTSLLGKMRYRLLATHDFVVHWFPHGIDATSLRAAPLLVFDPKDKLQADFLLQHFGIEQDQSICHFIPSTEGFLQALKLGIGYGMLPDSTVSGTGVLSGMTDLCPGLHTDVLLYWHHWQAQSPKAQHLTELLTHEARTRLRQ